MSKHVYSLVLMDEVVEAIDRLAYQQNTSRSNLINQILAEKVCCTTPQMRMNDIFNTISSRMTGDCFQVQPQPSDAMLSIRSALKYKYKPTIRYSLELVHSPGRTLGALKVSFRTQSAQLLSELTVFYKLWAALEHQFLLPGMPEGIHYQIEAGRFIRTFRLPPDQEELSTDQIGEYIAGYIRLFDHILKVYFAALPQGQDTALEAATAAYRKLLPKKIVHI